MKLSAIIASAALAFAPLSALANDTQVASAQPVPGGVAKSSIDFGSDPALVAAIIAAGGSLVIAGVIFAITQNDDGSFVVTTTTN